MFIVYWVQIAPQTYNSFEKNCSDASSTIKSCQIFMGPNWQNLSRVFTSKTKKAQKLNRYTTISSKTKKAQKLYKIHDYFEFFEKSSSSYGFKLEKARLQNTWKIQVSSSFRILSQVMHWLNVVYLMRILPLGGCLHRFLLSMVEASNSIRMHSNIRKIRIYSNSEYIRIYSNMKSHIWFEYIRIESIRFK